MSSRWVEANVTDLCEKEIVYYLDGVFDGWAAPPFLLEMARHLVSTVQFWENLR
jgi:hypothetical protein